METLFWISASLAGMGFLAALFYLGCAAWRLGSRDDARD